MVERNVSNAWKIFSAFFQGLKITRLKVLKLLDYGTDNHIEVL